MSKVLDSTSAPGRAEAIASSSQRRRHIDHIEGMRAVAALVVYVNHAYAQSFLLNGTFHHPAGLLAIAGYSMVCGHLAVTVFITISGFCLTLPVVTANGQLRDGVAAFFKRRARRTLPAYYGSLALCLALIGTIIGTPTGTLWDVPIVVSPRAILSHLFMMQDFIGTSRISYVLWSIAVEWHIYFLFPVLVWTWRRFGPIRTVMTAFIVGYGLLFGLANTRLVRSSSPHFVGIFTLGMLAAYVATSPGAWYVRRRVAFPWAALGTITATLAALLIVVWGIDAATTHFAVLDLLVGVTAASLLIVSSSTEDNGASRLFSWKPLVMVGTFSYSVYLLHAPLLQVFWQYVARPANLSQTVTFVSLMTIGLALVLGLSYGFYRVFEEPFMRRSSASRLRNAIPAETPVRVEVA
jgi:peptidoglycan/LPS O-acetylase OafA/YrhL